MSEPKVLQMMPLTPAIQAQAEAAFTLRKLWESADQRAFVGAVAPGVRAHRDGGGEPGQPGRQRLTHARLDHGDEAVQCGERPAAGLGRELERLPHQLGLAGNAHSMLPAVPRIGGGAFAVVSRPDQIRFILVPHRIGALTDAERPFPIGRPAWADTAILVPEKRSISGFSDVLTGRSIRTRGGALSAAELLARFPVAVLVGGEREPAA